MADKKPNNKKNNNNKRKNNGADDDYNPKFRKMRKKVCTLCSNKELVLDYKNRRTVKKVYK
jgi:ribosomal protein S18